MNGMRISTHTPLALFRLLRPRGYGDVALTGSRAVIILASCLASSATECITGLHTDAVF